MFNHNVLSSSFHLLVSFVPIKILSLGRYFLVIDILDELKKEQREARDAIRWLENQFRAGNRYEKTLNLKVNLSWIFRFIRTQAVHERLTNPNKKKTTKTKDFFRFQDILDCCLYFSQQSNLEKQTTNNSISTVNLLIARSLTNKEQQSVEKDGKYSWLKK